MIKYIIIFPLFFPWFNFGLNNNDSQVYPGIIALSYLLISKKLIIPKFIPALIVTFLIGLVISLPLSNFELSIMARSVYGYFSFFLILIAAYNLMIKKDIKNITINANIIWLIGGLISLISPDFIALLNESRTSPGRGSTSFSPEPTYFAMTLILFSILIYIQSGLNFRSNFIIHFLNAIFIVVVAKSTMGLFYLTAGFLIYIITRLSWRINFLVLINIVIFGPILFDIIENYFQSDIFQEYRISEIIQILNKENIIFLLINDASINERVEHIYLSFTGAYKNFFIPHGIGTFGLHRSEYIQPYEDVFWYAIYGSVNIMSWIGDWIFQLGIFGVIVLLILLYNILVTCKKEKPLILYLTMILISAIPVAFPMVPFVIAALISVRYFDETFPQCRNSLN